MDTTATAYKLIAELGPTRALAAAQAQGFTHAVRLIERGIAAAKQVQR